MLLEGSCRQARRLEPEWLQEQAKSWSVARCRPCRPNPSVPYLVAAIPGQAVWSRSQCRYCRMWMLARLTNVFPFVILAAADTPRQFDDYPLCRQAPRGLNHVLCACGIASPLERKCETLVATHPDPDSCYQRSLSLAAWYLQRGIS